MRAGPDFPAPCGTKAAYERHLRRKEPVDEECRLANTKAQRKTRAEARKPDVPPPPVSVPEESSRLGDLERQRDVLWTTIQWAVENDPARVPAMSKELREVWAELGELKDDEGVKDDPFDQFFSAPISLAERREMA